MEVLKIKSLSTGYNTHVVGSDINVALNVGDMVALVGPNGAGKSTLFKTLCGHIKPISGSIAINGSNIAEISPKERAKLMSVVLTERIDDMFMSVHDVVASGRFPYIGMFGKLGKTDENIIQDSLDIIGIKSLSDRLFNTLSDGERQKVMIAKAISQNTPIILLDEPTAFLDYPSKIELFSILKKLCVEQNKTIVFSSHDLELLLRYTDYLWVMASNKPFIAGKCAELLGNGIIQNYFRLKNVDDDDLKNNFTYFCKNL